MSAINNKNFSDLNLGNVAPKTCTIVLGKPLPMPSSAKIENTDSFTGANGAKPAIVATPVPKAPISAKATAKENLALSAQLPGSSAITEKFFTPNAKARDEKLNLANTQQLPGSSAVTEKFFTPNAKARDEKLNLANLQQLPGVLPQVITTKSFQKADAGANKEAFAGLPASNLMAEPSEWSKFAKKAGSYFAAVKLSIASFGKTISAKIGSMFKPVSQKLATFNAKVLSFFKTKAPVVTLDDGINDEKSPLLPKLNDADATSLKA